jgi:hypothetical protein
VNWETVRSEIRNELESKNEPVSRLAQKISQKYGLSKNKVYQEALEIRKQSFEFGIRNAECGIENRTQKSKDKK